MIGFVCAPSAPGRDGRLGRPLGMTAQNDVDGVGGAVRSLRRGPAVNPAAMVGAMSETSTVTEPIVPIFETQPERADLPLVVLPSVIDGLIEPIKANVARLRDVARVRVFEEFTADEDAIAARCEGADAMFVGGFHISDALLGRLYGAGVRCIVFCGTGVASYVDLDKAGELGVRVCNAQHYGDAAVAEHTFALLFELVRRTGALDAGIKAGHWAGADGIQLNGKRLAIIGLGGIGVTVARIAAAFGMRVSAWSNHVPAAMFESCGATPVDDLDELIAGADVVSVHMPLMDATRGIITAGNLAHLRPGTLFINTARAEVIEPGALLARLQRGDVPAALDVFDHEPIGGDDPLCSVPGIVLTPHVAWRTDAAFADLGRQMTDSMLAYFRGQDHNVIVSEADALGHNRFAA